MGGGGGLMRIGRSPKKFSGEGGEGGCLRNINTS